MFIVGLLVQNCSQRLIVDFRAWSARCRTGSVIAWPAAISRWPMCWSWWFRMLNQEIRAKASTTRWSRCGKRKSFSSNDAHSHRMLSNGVIDHIWSNDQGGRFVAVAPQYGIRETTMHVTTSLCTTQPHVGSRSRLFDISGKTTRKFVKYCLYNDCRIYNDTTVVQICWWFWCDDWITYDRMVLNLREL
jgi:hypothetical protein